jgi:hypothetical protein
LLVQALRVLGSSETWAFDAFALADATHKHALSALGFYSIQRAGLVQELRLSPERLARCGAGCYLVLASRST